MWDKIWKFCWTVFIVFLMFFQILLLLLSFHYISLGSNVSLHLFLFFINIICFCANVLNLHSLYSE